MAVSINGTSGTWSHGNTVTISGAGFTTHADYGGSQSFLNAAYNPVGSTLSSLNDGNCYHENSATYQWSILSATPRRSGAYYAHRVFIDSEGGEWGHYQNTNTGYLFTSFWMRVAPLNSQQSGKYWRAYGSNSNIYLSTGALEGTPNLETRGFSECSTCSPSPSTVWGSPLSFTGNTWTRIDILQRWGTGGVDWFEIRQNNTLQWRRASSLSGEEDQKWTPDNYSPVGHTVGLGGMLDAEWRGYPTTGFYDFCDFYIDYSWARVELGNANTRTACTVLEQQVPLSWNASSIQIQVNTGAFTNGQKAYVYVSDSTGAFNTNGYEITINSGSTVITPVAAFVGSPLSGQSPLTVNFTDQSTNAPESWLWNFGANASPATSATQNPSTTYAYGGTKTVTLTATNTAGSDDETKAGYVSARYLKPTNFQAS